MSDTRFGISGGIGAPRSTNYIKGGPAPGTKSNGPISRMGISGGFARFARDYSGKLVGSKSLYGGVQAGVPTLSGSITRTAFRTVSGGIQAQPPILAGTITADKIASGGVQSGVPTVSGAVTKYPLTGYTLTNFTVDYSGLDTDSPFSGDITYQDILIGDKCHFETLTDPSGSTMSMDGAGQFTISPPSVVIETFDFQIYDASDGTFGLAGTITVHPTAADSIVSGGVQAGVPTLSGNVNSFTIHAVSGGVQAGSPTLFGQITEGDAEIVQGGVQSGPPSLSGSIARTVKVSGGLQAGTPTLSGNLRKIVGITGGVQAQPPTLDGVVIRRLPHSLAPARRTIKMKTEDRTVRINSESRKFYGTK